ncbi:MAG: ABC transporter ATP-binding protein [Candidatus Hydrogenedentes bacterium]|nr:ABC transporter ATP-binding protein [Candidatus Hydrogenedentota bacterium]
MSAPIVELRGIMFAYDTERVVLNNLSLAISPGERIGMRGANGSGKTTLLHLMVGLVTPTAGEILCFDAPRRSEADFLDVRRRVGLLFQDSDDQLFCPTVGEDVAFGPLNLGVTRDEARRRTLAALEAVGLRGYEDRITYKLSGGEKRLAALATVLAMEPDVLLLDEPLTGLDEEHEQRVVAILDSLPQAMLIVSHDKTFLSRIASRQVELKQGCIR